MQTEVKTLDIRSTPFFIPPSVGRGDRDFGGNGPNVLVSTTLSIRNQREVWASVYMHAMETKKDWSEAEGTAEYLVHREPQANRILKIMSNTSSFASYTDTNHDVDRINLSAGGLVREFECVGDTRGNDAGVRTGVRAHFNPIKIEVEKGEEPRIKTIRVDPTPRFIPTHVGGDRDFGGNGPFVTVSAQITVENYSEIWARVWMHAKETKADWTEAMGSTRYVLYKHDKPIQAILSSTYSQVSYTDTNHTDDTLTLAGGDLVYQFVCTGDTKGNEAGTSTGVVVYFNPITFREA